MANRTAYRQPQVGNQGFSRTMKCLGSSVSILTTDLVLNQTVGLFVAPKGFILKEINVTVTDMDSNGSPTVAFTIGDAASAARFVAAATTAQAGGTTTTLAATGLFYEFLADTEIVWTTSTAAATAVAGTVTPYFFGWMK